MSASDIARRHFNAALDEAKTANMTGDVIARHTLALVIKAFLAHRSTDDVKRELLAAGENVDPEADLIFMRP